MITHYVAGFMFHAPEVPEVALILKRRGPNPVVGKWNGIGGKVEHCEMPIEAMVREFFEETGVRHQEWEPFCDLRDANGAWAVHFYRTFVDQVTLHSVRSTTDEEVRVVSLRHLDGYPLVSNLRWLIPLALHRKTFGVHALDRIAFQETRREETGK